MPGPRPSPSLGGAPFVMGHWNPLELQPRLWVDAIQEAARVGMAPGGIATALSQVSDFGAGGRHFSQADSNKQVALTHANNRFHIAADGTADIMVRATDDLGSAIQSGYLAIGLERVSSVAATRVLFGTSDEASTTRYFYVGISTAGKLIVVQRNGDTEDLLTGDTTMVVDTPYIIEAWSDGSTTFGAVNGVAQTFTATTGANTGDWVADTQSRDSYTMFGRKRTTEDLWAPANISSLLWTITAVPSAEDRQRHRKYVNHRYNFGIAV